MQGFDIGAVVHWISQYEDDNISLSGSHSAPIKLQTPRTQGPLSTLTGEPNPDVGLQSPRARKVAAWTTLDLIASYTFNLPPPASAEVPGFAKDAGKNVKMKDDKEKNITLVDRNRTRSAIQA
jgi:hypothetical protein